MARIFLGVVLGVALTLASLFAWFRFGRPPVAVADKPLSMAPALAHAALEARIDREAGQPPSLDADATNLIAGAEVYRDHCAACHGYHRHDVGFASHMAPAAPQLWASHPGQDAVGLSGTPLPRIHWMTANGVRGTGMPAFRNLLTDQELWQVSLLLASANKPLPPGALLLLNPAAPPTLADTLDHAHAAAQ